VVTWQLQTELEAIIACSDVGGDRMVCVNYHRPGLVADARVAMQAWSSIGPETRSNRCYRRLVSYGRVLSDLQTGHEAVFPVIESGQEPKLRDVERRARTAAEAHNDAAERVLAACT
jgi:hypothetical protein